MRSRVPGPVVAVIAIFSFTTVLFFAETVHFSYVVAPRIEATRLQYEKLVERYEAAIYPYETAKEASEAMAKRWADASSMVQLLEKSKDCVEFLYQPRPWAYKVPPEGSWLDGSCIHVTIRKDLSSSGTTSGGDRPGDRGRDSDLRSEADRN